jgi:hypothetical protein
MHVVPFSGRSAKRQPPEWESYENEVNKFFTMNGWNRLPSQKNSNLPFNAYR